MSYMEIDPDEDILNIAARDSSMDYAAWPALLPTLLKQIDKIAHNDFPIPYIPPPRPPVRAPSPRLVAPLPSSDPVAAPGSSGTTPSSQETNKENANPASLLSGTAATNAAPPSSTAVTTTGNPPAQQDQPEPGALPPQVAAMLNEILSTLKEGFEHYPPHTIQRLSELLLRPRQHYRHLVAYLHALDRVVHVTSGANTYPLPPAIPDMSSMSSNGGSGGSGTGLAINSTLANNIGSDEALGGALLTPIPWLSKSTNGGGSDDLSDAGSSSPLSSNSARPQQQLPQSRQIAPGGRKPEPQLRTESTETIEGPNGMGSIETVTISLGGLASTGPGTGLANRGVTQSSEFIQGATPSSQHIKDEQETSSGSEEKEPEKTETAELKTDDGDGDKGGDKPMEGVEPAEVKEEEKPTTSDTAENDGTASGGKPELETGNTE